MLIAVLFGVVVSKKTPKKRYLLLALVENPAVPGLENFPEPAIIFIQIMCTATTLTSLFDHLSAPYSPYHPPRAVYLVLGLQWTLIGACNPMLCPLHDP